jgi:hypothetical protein
MREECQVRPILRHSSQHGFINYLKIPPVGSERVNIQSVCHVAVLRSTEQHHPSLVLESRAVSFESASTGFSVDFRLS